MGCQPATNGGDGQLNVWRKAACGCRRGWAAVHCKLDKAGVLSLRARVDEVMRPIRVCRARAAVRLPRGRFAVVNHHRQRGHEVCRWLRRCRGAAVPLARLRVKLRIGSKVHDGALHDLQADAEMQQLGKQRLRPRARGTDDGSR